MKVIKFEIVIHQSNMFLQLLLFYQYFIILLLILIPPSSFSGAVTLPDKGCEVKCGNLSIPFPFGIGPDCSLEPSFDVKCNTSTNPPKAYLSRLNIQVIEINQTYIRVIYPNPVLVSACYDLSTDYQHGNGMSTVIAESPAYKHVTSMSHSHVNLSGTPFTLSDVNSLVVIGCDDVVIGFDQPNGTTPIGGCSTVCTAKNHTPGAVGYCSTNEYSSLGNGCGNFPIPSGARFLRAELMELSGKLGRRKFYPCSYAYIQESGWESGEADVFSFPFPFHYLSNATAMLVHDDWASPPAVRLNWMLGEKNCTQAKAYACQHQKTYCIDNDDYYSITTGYLCKCIKDYEGNPYLPAADPDGCKPISGDSSYIGKTGCQEQCGQLSIPYPFGMEENCYQAPSFIVRCNSSTDTPTAYLVALDAEIIEFSNSSRVKVVYPNVGFACYNLSDAKTEGSTLTVDLGRTQFTLSNDNWITVVGCNDMMLGSYGPANRTFMGSSCTATCSNQNDFGSCPGFGCCRAAIPKGTSYLEANLGDLISGQRQRTNFSCSYTFVDHKYSYKDGYPLVNNSTALSQLNEERRSEIELDWRVGAVSCDQARLNQSTFACRENTVCVDFDATLGGYLCNCSQGYEGNPYLSPGCSDIDECADHSTNPCYPNSKCNNTLGSFQCLCPEGYSGDGKKDGKGCIQQQQTKFIILIGMGSGLGFLLLLLMCFWFHKVFQKKKVKMAKQKFFKRNGGLLLRQQTNEGALGKTKVFPANELEVATDHFNASRILGQGGQGTVYKGMLFDGTIVAIKKSKLVEVNQLEQFINEVVILSQINHRNIVKLLGCCLETEVPLLVYEFMPYGTLFDLIHDPNNEFQFPWSMRLKIAADIAGALAYLHSALAMPIYHRDIKSSNILLDEKYVVKVSDFGTSRSVDADQTHVSTIVKGTFGYLDPEYFQSSQFTEKSDVYSFGVVLVELLTGQRPISLDIKKDEDRGLATRFLVSMEENSLDAILDPKVLEQGRKEEVVLVAKLAKRCLNLKGKMRPTMKEVAVELESSRISQMSTIVEDEFEDFEDTPTISNIEYTSWTDSYKDGSTSSSIRHPLILTTV